MQIDLTAFSHRLKGRDVVPLSDALLRKHNFFELYPPDVIGRSDEDFGREVSRTHVIHPGGKMPRIDWRQYERWRSAEHSCVLNRFYFLASLARYCALRRDPAMARLLVETMLDFIAACPAPHDPQAIAEHIQRTLYIQHHDYNLKSHDEILKDETDIQYVWFDFQPASRLMHFIYALHFLRDYDDCMSDDERLTICRSLYEHAWVIYHGERSVKPLAGDNHQSTRAAALMLAAAFFQGIGLWREFAEQAASIIAFHSRESFFPDGVLKEISPSYHTSVAWHVRDCWILSQRLGIALDPNVEKQLRRSIDYIRAMLAPNGRTAVIDDGREVAPSAWLASMETFENAAEKREAFFFPDAGVAALRREGIFLVFDGSTFTGEISHYQGGKNGVIYWLRDRPILIDSGCPDLYDDPLFSRWYKLAEAHGTLLVDGHGDARLEGFTRFTSYPTIQGSGWVKDADNRTITNVLTSNDPAWSGVRWTRTLRIDAANQLHIADTIESPREVNLTLIFNLHPDVKVTNENGRILALENPPVKIQMTFDADAPPRLERAPGKVYFASAHHDSTQLRLHLAANGATTVNTQFLVTG